jgi:hypothetical protein
MRRVFRFAEEPPVNGDLLWEGKIAEMMRRKLWLEDLP